MKSSRARPAAEYAAARWGGLRMPKGLASFDSASAMAVATACVLRGQDFPALGQPAFLRPIIRYSDILPTRVRLALYAASTGLEGVKHREIGGVSADDIATWATGLYPRRRYPLVIIGASNGALCHLAAAIDAPWLPQTFLVPLRREGGGVDDPSGDMEQAREAGMMLLTANRQIQLHQMHDPNQDRLSLRHLTYFRIKFRRLPEAYRAFLRDRLEPGGIVLVSDCLKRWPTKRVGDRYVFQFGAVGGMEAREYLERSARVAEFLARHGSRHRHWDPPAADGEGPEAEWGFEGALTEDIEAVADAVGLRTMRLAFDEPEDLSPLVADFHRDWYRAEGIPADRLVAESFILLEPYWVLKSGSIPFWMTFNMRPSLDSLIRYVTGRDAFDSIRVMLFSHGARSIGLPAIEDWRAAFGYARNGGAFLGVNEAAYPNHFSALARYHLEMTRLSARETLPEPPGFQAFLRFWRNNAGRYAARLSGY